ncbi:murein hydrolase activator EnvC family protein [Bartonella tamiae]|uniref:M23ase beta-sheet core domain-containing protein n=1 Tax=Bartonella tamiae Th239 TaxID=1094558 RepID=J0QWM0_9HYPH|nr:peptidoglycan DD-metalloendopeptidase family protein [Bartonella tamiae]EJF90401.1 hypothetical protein ME5_00802 [Bartonella tamiae Th239]EJF93655.1 hypothetical protein MEG_01079 [Bartonella tamiae Th307]
MFFLVNLLPVFAFSQDRQSHDAASKALFDIRQTMSLSREKVSELAKQVDSLKKDQRTLTSELVKAAKLERDATENIAQSEEKLEQLLIQKKTVEKDLFDRKAEFAEVLAALERMGLNPPPAILVRPDDALASVRSSVLLGALVPDMREKTRALSASLKDLTRVSVSIQQERDTMKKEVNTQAEQQKRLALLLEQKAKLEKTSEAELIVQRKKSRELAEKARSLEDLLAELERQSRSPSSPSTLSESDLRLHRAQEFSQQKGQLLLPVSGKRIQKFGANKGAIVGDTIETAPSAIVVAPTESIVAYAGPFRSYGQIVILDVGQDYHILLAGMARVDVNQGQFLLSGEPLGAMGTQLIASAGALDIGKSAPMLYIELRKQGKPVDPAPWWGAGKSGRNQNDS